MIRSIVPFFVVSNEAGGNSLAVSIREPESGWIALTLVGDGGRISTGFDISKRDAGGTKLSGILFTKIGAMLDELDRLFGLPRCPPSLAELSTMPGDVGPRLYASCVKTNDVGRDPALDPVGDNNEPASDANESLLERPLYLDDDDNANDDRLLASFNRVVGDDASESRSYTEIVILLAVSVLCADDLRDNLG